jgi:glucoamylase
MRLLNIKFPVLVGMGTKIQSIIGNGRMLSCIGQKGEIHHLFWPAIDYPQHCESVYAGIYTRKSLSWFIDETWKRRQEYISNTNILKTVYQKQDFEVEGYDFTDIESDVHVRWFSIKNNGSKPVSIKFFRYQSLQISETKWGDALEYIPQNDSILQYYRHFYFALGSDLQSSQHQCGIRGTDSDALLDAKDGLLKGDDLVISLGKHGVNSSFVWDFEEIAPSQQKSIAFFICAGSSRKDALSIVEHAKETGVLELMNNTLKYWRGWVAHCRQPDVIDKEIIKAYHRSLLTLKLLCDKNSGGIIAAPSMDPEYRYCWPRDATYIAVALDMAGYHQETNMYYQWCKAAQEPEGGWYQRYFVESNLPGPCWGDQIDETGTILWGAKIHYALTRDYEFLVKIWQMVKKAADYLCSLQDEDTGLIKESIGLWEESPAKHLYSEAAVCAGLKASHDMAKILGHEKMAEKWGHASNILKESIMRSYWDEKNQIFIKSIDPLDTAIDMSALCLTTPFDLLPVDDPRIKGFIEKAEKVLKNRKVGGFGRYTNDSYYGGNPWILTTLWLALYYIKAGQQEKAVKLIHWCRERATESGMLPEQINMNGEPLSAVPMGWSHAMFVIAALKLQNK